jgi:predicted O-methyltransferase YrrM
MVATGVSQIRFPIVDLRTTENPIPAIVSAPDFRHTLEFFTQSPASSRSLLPAMAQALIFSLVRNERPEHVVEIGTYKGGTTEGISRALDGNGRGLIHTLTPFDSELFLPYLETWPENLRARVHFYPLSSMDFFIRAQREKINPGFVLVDGNHDYEFALFDIQCAARSLDPGGFIAVDNVSQVGPYLAVMDFMKANPEWINCEWQAGRLDPTKAYDSERRGIVGTDFIVLRAPYAYYLRDRPRTFGEVAWPSTKVQGLRLQLAKPNKGTLHIQCVLRGYGDPTIFERIGEISMAIDGEVGKLDTMFKVPLMVEESSRYSVEPWLIWVGSAPLALSEVPHVV